MTVSTKPQTISRQALTRRGVLAGLITAGVALGVGQLVAGITGPQGSPVATVGGAAIDLTPPPVKNFAISTFGSHDKTALVTGILAVLAVFAAVIGAAAMRRLGYGLAGVAAFAGVGLAAALTRPATGAADVVPVLVGAAAGAVTLVLLVRAATRAAAPPAGTQRRAAHAPAAPGAPASVTGRTVASRTAAGDPGASRVPAARGGSARDAVPREPAGPPPPGDGPPRGPGPADGQPPPPAEPGRRRFLATASVAVVAAGGSALAGRVLGERTSVARARSALRIPRPVRPGPHLPAGVDLRIPGLSPSVTPNSSFYRVDTALILPEVSPASWHLRVHGMVGREITLSFAELLRMPLTEDYITLCCVSNPVAGPYIGNARWVGVSLASVLRAARIRAGADQLLCTSVDGFTSGTPVQTVMDGRDALLAVAMNGTPLPVAHGFPVRMVVPGLYGYVSATKWVTDIKVTTFGAEQAYWVQRGWAQQAPIKTESRIDVPNGSTAVRVGRTPVAGVAWAQHKGIEAVEVRVDRGPWNRARLAAVPGIDTWRQWVWEWDATRGSHVIEARATDRTGYTQTALTVPPEPNGATGYPSITVSVQ